MVIDGTPYSFYPAKLIGQDIFSKDQLIEKCNGYDFNYCIERETEREPELCAILYDRTSGRKMECYTTMPGLQVFTANTLTSIKGKKLYKGHFAICLETQFYPNSPNCSDYPSPILKAGDNYYETTVYKFVID